MLQDQQVLDNPVWQALITGNKPLSTGTDTVKMFEPEVSLLVGMEKNTAENFDTLRSITQPDQVVILFSREAIDVPHNWKTIVCLSGYQMVYDALQAIDIQAEPVTVVPLSVSHVPAMLSLTKLTNPGPFSTRTIELGPYEGIFDDGTLVALAGQRLYAPPFAEISAVCTHPDYGGKGYARLLLSRQVNRMLAAGCQPFLHVREDNVRAVELYQRLGFAIRCPVLFYVLAHSS